MIEEVQCKLCSNKHFDHYECDYCGLNLGFLIPHINYCPNCGESIYGFSKYVLKEIAIVVNKTGLDK